MGSQRRGWLADGQGVIGAATAGTSTCLVFEAGRAGEAVATQPSTSGLTAVAHGNAAYAGNALYDGRHAIWALARFIDRRAGPCRRRPLELGDWSCAQGRTSPCETS